MIETSLVFPESIQQFLDIFGNVQKCSENAQENLWKVVGNLQKIVKNAVYMLHVGRRYEFYVLLVRTIHCSCHSNAKFIHVHVSSPHHVTSSGLKIEKYYSLPYFYFLAGQTNFGLPFMFFDLPQ